MTGRTTSRLVTALLVLATLVASCSSDDADTASESTPRSTPADVSMTTGDVLDRAGVLVGFHTDDGITDSRLFLRSPALAVRAGMARDKALQAVTIANARMLDLQDRIGTLTVGKDADFVVLSGDPLSVYTQVLQTWVEGQKVFDLADPQDRLMAMGGYGASRDQAMSMCCFGTQEGQ